MNKFLALGMFLIIIIMGLAGCSEMDLQDLEVTVDEETETETETSKSVEERVKELEEKLLEEEVVEAEGNEMETEKTSLTKEEESYVEVVISVSSITQEFSAVLNGVTKNENSLGELDLHYGKVNFALMMLNDMIEDNVVPEIFESMHSYLVGMCESIVLSQTYLMEGFKENDEVKINKGADYLEESTDYTIKVEEEYKTVIEKYKGE